LSYAPQYMHSLSADASGALLADDPRASLAGRQRVDHLLGDVGQNDALGAAAGAHILLGIFGLEIRGRTSGSTPRGRGRGGRGGEEGGGQMGEEITCGVSPVSLEEEPVEEEDKGERRRGEGKNSECCGQLNSECGVNPRWPPRYASPDEHHGESRYPRKSLHLRA
jgi:hypothetical protein